MAKKMSAKVAMEAVSAAEMWNHNVQLLHALEFIERKKLGRELFAFLEEKATSEDSKARDSEE